MSQNNMELLKWGVGETCLTYWDSLHGKDRVFVLRKDGAFERKNEDDYDVLYPVVLHQELLKLAEELSRNKCTGRTNDARQ